MKKIVLLIMASLLLLSGCNKSNEIDNAGLQSPAFYFHSHFVEFFENDKDITVTDMEKNRNFSVYTDNLDKYCALMKAYNGGAWKYKSEKVIINFEYQGEKPIPNNFNKNATITNEDLKALFENNSNFVEFKVSENPMLKGRVYAAFTKDIHSFYIDNLTNPYTGNRVCTTEDLAKVVFDGCKLGVTLCTYDTPFENDSRLKLVDPVQYWVNHFAKFFGSDTYIDDISFGNDDILKVKVNDLDKYCALFKTFNGGNWHYGSADIKIEFEYTGGPQPNNIYDTEVSDLFKGNKYFVKTKKQEGGFEFLFVVFKPEVIQTYVDSIGSINGHITKSVEDVAGEILFADTQLDVQFCSDLKE